MHARIENGHVVEWPIVNLRQRLPDVSLPEDLSADSRLPAGFVFVRPGTPPDHDPQTQEVVPAGPVRSGSRWVQGYEVRPLDEAELAARRAARAEERRRLRAQAFREEADPLFFKVQRGEAEQQAWLDKVAEIRARFPDPAETPAP